MYINFWYPMARSDEAKADEPFRTEVMGLKFVVFRDKEGQAHVLSDTCVHRGGSLSKGWVKDGCVICPYHGWRFNGDGKCATIPSIGYDGKPPARAKVDSYPVQEKYGIVFAFLGDLPEQERPPLFEIEEYDQEGWRANKLLVFDVDYHYERSIENGLDPAHNEFVHPTHGFSGQKPNYQVRDFDVEDLSHGCWFSVVMDSSGYKDDTMSKVRKSDGQTTAGSGTHGPNIMMTLIDITESSSLHQYVYEAPIDDNRTKIYFINMRNFLLDPEMDDRINERNMLVAHQDIDLLTYLNPVRTPSSNTKEILMPSDRCVLRYREWLKLWENKGWRIDMNELKAKQGDVAFAIPSPQRRLSGNWVLDPVPLMPFAHEDRKAAE
ncbi:MAG: aromatic ring-hydroxylating dioxygenase subunit alpha [Alphaproteobacteria bacterium]|nr:MAG: aromatic ring-hydroxylating dioxygenase subunit alpha [Alphaproteobacteria bacterium]